MTAAHDVNVTASRPCHDSEQEERRSRAGSFLPQRPACVVTRHPGSVSDLDDEGAGPSASVFATCRTARHSSKRAHAAAGVRPMPVRLTRREAPASNVATAGRTSNSVRAGSEQWRPGKRSSAGAVAMSAASCTSSTHSRSTSDTTTKTDASTAAPSVEPATERRRAGRQAPPRGWGGPRTPMPWIPRRRCFAARALLGARLGPLGAVRDDRP